MNVVGVPPDTAENHHNPDSNNTIYFDETLDHLLHHELNDLDFVEFSLQRPPLLPNIMEMPPIDSIPAEAEPPQLPSLTVAGAGADPEGKGGVGNVMNVRHHRKSFTVGGPSISLSLKKKAIPPEMLAEIAAVHPKRAKRILANRDAAKRSKEKRKHYEKELVKMVESLQIQADNATAERVIAMNEAMELADGNNKIKEHILSDIENQEKKRAFLEKLKEERDILKMQIQEQRTTIDSSSGELPSQSQSQVPHQSQLYIPQLPPLSPDPPSPIVGPPFDDHFIDFSNYNPFD